MQQCGRGSLMNAITQKEAGIFDQLTFRCEYPNWRSALNREFPKAERCDAPAAFIVIHHHCLEGEINSDSIAELLFCSDHTRIVSDWWVNEYHRVAEAGADGIQCLLCLYSSRALDVVGHEVLATGASMR